jgi:hypothetical protein
MITEKNIVKSLLNPDGSWNQDQYDKIVRSKRRYLKYIHDGLDDENPMIREGCAEALGDIGFLSSVPVLINHISDSCEYVRWDIMNSLEKILGFQPGALMAWTGCSLRHRNKIKKSLPKFWSNNRDYLLTGDRHSTRDIFWFNW